MAIRDDILSRITTNLSGHTSYSISSELPYTTDQVLYLKNMRTIYVDEQQEEVTALYNTLDNNDINQTLTTVTAYLAVDAKNQTSDIDTVVSNVLLARDGVTAPIKDSNVTTEIENDVLTYTFEYNFVTV
jgi:predicted nucleotidyltransferase